MRLRVCASCEWIFSPKRHGIVCPLCGFGSYTAYYVYRNKAYKYKITQEPWKTKKIDKYTFKLDKKIKQSREKSEGR